MSKNFKILILVAIFLIIVIIVNISISPSKNPYPQLLSKEEGKYGIFSIGIDLEREMLHSYDNIDYMHVYDKTEIEAAKKQYPKLTSETPIIIIFDTHKIVFKAHTKDELISFLINN